MNRLDALYSLVGGRMRDALFCATAAIIAVATAYVHSLASLTLPVPWGDEAYFVWQARAFERWNTFVAPELDATRPILLLPFTYAATLGSVFKIVGFSLEAARHLSFVFVLTGFAFLSLLVRRHAAPLIALVLVGVFLLNGNFVAMGNVARMEAFLFAVVCGALLLVQRGQTWMSLAVLSLSPMIHPNGVFFLGPVAIYAVLVLQVHRERPSNGAIAVFVLSAALWAANGLYALSYWDGFVHDTALRVGETLKDHEGASQFGGFYAFGLACIAITAVVGARYRIPVGYLLVFAVGAWLLSRVRTEQWYEPFGDFAYLLLSLALLELVVRVPTSFGVLKRPWSRPVAAGALAAGLLVIHVANGTIEGPRNYVHDMRVAGMRLEDSVAYFTPHDQKAVGDFLASLAPDRDVVVEIYPWGDGLLIANHDEARVRFQVPYFSALFFDPTHWAWGYGPSEYPLPDVYLLRVSRYHPSWLEYRHAEVLTEALKRSGVETPTVIHTRDETETWYAIRPGMISK